MPRARVVNGYSSTRYKLTILHVIWKLVRLTDEESVGEGVVSHVVARRVCKHPENDETANRSAFLVARYISCVIVQLQKKSVVCSMSRR